MRHVRRKIKMINTKKCHDFKNWIEGVKPIGTRQPMYYAFIHYLNETKCFKPF